MEVCLIIMGFCMLAMAGLIVFLTSAIRTLQNHALKATDAIVNVHERLEILEKAAIRKVKKEFDKKKKTREE